MRSCSRSIFVIYSILIASAKLFQCIAFHLIFKPFILANKTALLFILHQQVPRCIRYLDVPTIITVSDIYLISEQMFTLLLPINGFIICHVFVFLANQTSLQQQRLTYSPTCNNQLNSARGRLFYDHSQSTRQETHLQSSHYGVFVAVQHTH